MSRAGVVFPWGQIQIRIGDYKCNGKVTRARRKRKGGPLLLTVELDKPYRFSDTGVPAEIYFDRVWKEVRIVRHTGEPEFREVILSLRLDD